MFLLPSLLILCIYTYCTVVLLYCIMTNALHTYADCDWFHICKDLRKVNKYMAWYIWYDMYIPISRLVLNVGGFLTSQQSLTSIFK